MLSFCHDKATRFPRPGVPCKDRNITRGCLGALDQTIDSSGESKMKVVATLPDAKYFQAIESKKPGIFRFEDKLSPLLRIDAGVSSPWGVQWKILVGIKKGCTRAGLEYPQALILRCFPIDEEQLPFCTIQREEWKGKFAHSLAPTLFFAAIPCSRDNNYWLMLSVFEK